MRPDLDIPLPADGAPGAVRGGDAYTRHPAVLPARVALWTAAAGGLLTLGGLGWQIAHRATYRGTSCLVESPALGPPFCYDDHRGPAILWLAVAAAALVAVVALVVAAPIAVAKDFVNGRWVAWLALGWGVAPLGWEIWSGTDLARVGADRYTSDPPLAALLIAVGGGAFTLIALALASFLLAVPHVPRPGSGVGSGMESARLDAGSQPEALRSEGTRPDEPRPRPLAVHAAIVALGIASFGVGIFYSGLASHASGPNEAVLVTSVALAVGPMAIAALLLAMGRGIGRGLTWTIAGFWVPTSIAVASVVVLWLLPRLDYELGESPREIPPDFWPSLAGPLVAAAGMVVAAALLSRPTAHRYMLTRAPAGGRPRRQLAAAVVGALVGAGGAVAVTVAYGQFLTSPNDLRVTVAGALCVILLAGLMVVIVVGAVATLRGRHEWQRTTMAVATAMLVAAGVPVFGLLFVAAGNGDNDACDPSLGCAAESADARDAVGYGGGVLLVLGLGAVVVLLSSSAVTTWAAGKHTPAGT